MGEMEWERTRKINCTLSTTEQVTRTETRALVPGELAEGPAALPPRTPPRTAHPRALRTHGSGSQNHLQVSNKYKEMRPSLLNIHFKV